MEDWYQSHIESGETYFTVETWNVNYRVTRRVVCRDLDTAYSVAARLRKRIAFYCDRFDTFPLCSTPIRITEFIGSSPGSGRVLACCTWEGKPTMTEALESARNAEWYAIDPAHTAGGACVPMPNRRKVRM